MYYSTLGKQCQDFEQKKSVSFVMNSIDKRAVFIVNYKCYTF